MAKKSTPSKNRSSHAKRVGKGAPKSSAQKQAAIDAQRAEKERIEKRRQTAQRSKKIMAIVFSIVLILAFAIPTVGLIAMNSNNAGTGGDTGASEPQ